MISNNFHSISSRGRVFLIVGGRQAIRNRGAGTVGVVYSFGSIVGQVDEGFHLICRGGSSPTRISKCKERYWINCRPLARRLEDVFVRASLNYEVSPKAVQTLFAPLGRIIFMC